MTDLEREALKALQSAPTKYRIDFDPYWEWYDKMCVPIMEKLEAELQKSG